MRNLIFEELSQQSFGQWKNSPVTKAYLQFLEDQTTVFREAALDLFESGLLDPQNPNPNSNANVIRGRLMTLRELQALELDAIQTFYQQSEEE